ncbi:MAG: hypothetical protein K1W16_05205 [Lachnospiraceae bacterium]
MQDELNISKETATEKKQINYYARKQMGLKARPEDDEIVREIIRLLAQKGITVDRARNVLKDVRTLLPRLAKLSYKDSFKYDS